jgi:prepilin-type N-terminal cleavage/methylation domain-containing protein
MSSHRERRGFSLIELPIVIVIILVILIVAIPNAHQMMMSGREMAAIREIQTIQQEAPLAPRSTFTGALTCSARAYKN